MYQSLIRWHKTHHIVAKQFRPKSHPPNLTWNLHLAPGSTLKLLQNKSRIFFLRVEQSWPHVESTRCRMAGTLRCMGSAYGHRHAIRTKLMTIRLVIDYLIRTISLSLRKFKMITMVEWIHVHWTSKSLFLGGHLVISEHFGSLGLALKGRSWVKSHSASTKHAYSEAMGTTWCWPPLSTPRLQSLDTRICKRQDGTPCCRENAVPPGQRISHCGPCGKYNAFQCAAKTKAHINFKHLHRRSSQAVQQDRIEHWRSI